MGVTGESGEGLSLALTRLLGNRNLGDSLKARLFGSDGTAQSVGLRHKLVVSLEEAKLFEPLTEAIADTDLRDELSASLEDFDDVSVDLRFAPVSKNRGRDIAWHGDLVGDIQAAAIAATSTAGDMLAAEDAVNEILQRTGLGNADLDRPMRDALAPADALALATAMESARRAHFDYLTQYESVARRLGLYDLMNLVNNQPQLVISVQSRLRDELVGPDEHSLKFSYEVGGANVNRLRRYIDSQAALPAARGGCRGTVACLGDYMMLNRDVVEAGNRFSLSLSLVEKQRYDFDRFDIRVHVDSLRSAIAELRYGRYLDVGLADLGIGGKSRIDFRLSYEDVGDDRMRQSRALANATFTQEINDGLFLTLGLVWANKPEFRGEVDEEISARAGISYKLAKQ